MKYLKLMNNYSLFIIVTIVEFVFFIFLQRISTVSGKKRVSVLTDPLSMFIIAASIIYLLVPLLMVTFNWRWHDQQYTLQSYLKANLVVFGYILLVYLCYLFIGNQIFKTNKHLTYKNRTEQVKYHTLTKKQFLILITVFSIPIWLATIYLVQYVFSFELAEYLRDRISLNRGKGPIILISSMGTILVPILYVHFLMIIKNKKKHTRSILTTIFSLIIIVPFLIAYTVMGSRLTAFILIILLFLAHLSVRNRVLSIKTVINYFLFLITIFITFTLIGYIRILGGDITSVNWSLLFKVYSKELETALVSNFGNFEHLVWLIEHPSRWDAYYGQTFLAGFMNILPRSIFENKLLGGGPHLKNIIHPGSYAFSRTNITSYTTGIAIETFMNFKYLGLLIVPFFHALALQLLSRIVPKIKGNIILLAIYLYLLLSIGFLILFGEFLGQYTRALIVTLPFIFFYIFTKSENPTLKNVG